MSDALTFINGMRDMIWNGLASCNHPVLGVSFLTFFLAVFTLNLAIKLYSVVVGDNEKSVNGRMDNNNHYIYKR